MNHPGADVIVATDAFVPLNDDLVESLKHAATKAARGRFRYCAHRTLADPLHEMLIALSRDTYIRPHRHADKSESVHVIEGSGDLVRFDPLGGMLGVVRIAPYGAGRCFFYRMATPEYHMLIVRSDVLVVHETTNGPFAPGGTEFAPWAPEDGDVAGRESFLQRVEAEILACRALHGESD